MIEQITFNYNNNVYNYTHYKNDDSGIGCIREIVNNDEYILHNFNNNINKHFIDIGANYGVVTIILAKQNPQSIIYAFEPDKHIFKLLENNVKINALQNVRLFNLGVSKKEINKLKLFLHPSYSGGNTTYSDINSLETYFNSSIEYYEVLTTNLDSIIIENNINEIFLLKIDCEGAEYDILYNSDFLKENIVKNMIGEFHNLKYNTLVNSNYDSLIEYCKKYIHGIFKITKLDL
jgi:FkbM family methyltransferase